MGRGRTAPKPIDDLSRFTGKHLTSSQLATYFGVSRHTINEWIRKGKLAACKPGGYDWRIPVESARAMEAQLYVPRGKSA